LAKDLALTQELVLANELLEGPGSHSVSKRSLSLEFLLSLFKKIGLFF
jgi:hypothetical protein